MRRRLIVFCLVLLLAGVGAEVFLPRVVVRGLEVGLGNMLGGEPEVGLRAFPALKLLLGRFDRITVESRGVQMGLLLVDRLSSTLEHVAVNMRVLLLDRTLVVERVGRQGVTLRMSEQSLARYLAGSIEPLADPEVTLREGVASLRGNLDLGGRMVRLQVDGVFRLDGEDRTGVRYDVHGLRLDGVAVEGPFLPKLMEILGGPEVLIDLRQSPMPLRGTAVRVIDGWLIIEAQVAE